MNNLKIRKYCLPTKSVAFSALRMEQNDCFSCRLFPTHWSTWSPHLQQDLLDGVPTVGPTATFWLTESSRSACQFPDVTKQNQKLSRSTSQPQDIWGNAAKQQQVKFQPSSPGMGKLWRRGHMRPVKVFNWAHLTQFTLNLVSFLWNSHVFTKGRTQETLTFVRWGVLLYVCALLFDLSLLL